MQQTTHYGLNKPDPNDTYNKANDNANMDTIDAQMYANAQAAAAAQATANAAIPQSNIGETVASLVDGQVPLSQLGNVPALPNDMAKYDVSQTWTAVQTWAANSIIAALGIATSSNNYGSNQLQFQRSTWNGSAAVTDTSYLYKDANGVFHYVNSSGTSIWQVDNSGNVSANSFTANGNSVLTTASNYVSSINGSTGAVSGIATTGANTFTGTQTFNGGATVPSGETLTVAGTETVTGTLQASGSGVINATELGGQPSSYYAQASKLPSVGTIATAISGGYKIQSGSSSSSGSGGVSVSFPTAFSTTPIVVMGMDNGMGNTNATCGVGSVSTTGFTAYTSTYGGGFNWIAIGS